MKYRLVFRERSDIVGERADNPPSFLEPELDDETVLDAVFIARNSPDALHNSDLLEEDDAFLSIGTEVWEYDIAENKYEEFKNACLNSGMVIEFEPIESSDQLGVS